MASSPGSEGGSVSSPETEDLGRGPETSRVMEGGGHSVMVKFVKIWGL